MGYMPVKRRRMRGIGHSAVFGAHRADEPSIIRHSILTSRNRRNTLRDCALRLATACRCEEILGVAVAAQPDHAQMTAKLRDTGCDARPLFARKAPDAA